MSETDLSQLSAARQRVRPMGVPMERDLWNAFCVWEPSSQTQRLASEAHRNLYVELVTFHGGKTCRSFDSPTPERISQRIPKSLATLVVESLVENFNGGSVPASLSCCQRDEFGSMLSTELHLLKIVDIEIELYWQRVVWCCSVDPLSYYEHCSDSNFNWKRRAVELKLALLIERQDPRYWELEALEQTVEMVAQIVKSISIEQLMPFPSAEPWEDYESYTFDNTPDALCHHGSLEILGHLTNLTSLSLVFGVKNWTKAYRSRYSSFSSADIENLAVGLRKLTKLKSFTLTRSRMDPPKLAVLVQSFVHLPLAAIRLSHCQLGEGCGAILGRFLSQFGATLKQLDLAGNRLDAHELDQLCPGLGVYQGVVDRLDLSYNPIGAAGVLILGGAIKGKPQLSELNFTGCLMGVEGSFRTIQLMSFHAPLRKVSMNCVPISPAGQRKLVQVLRENMHIEAVQVRECGLSVEAQVQVRKILSTNAKRRIQSSSSRVKTTLKDENPINSIRSPASLFKLNRKVFGAMP